jgi:hypothetical protein
MKSEIIARACGSKCGTLGRKSNDCGFRGTLGGVASKSSSANSHASATEPMPIALRVRNCRRVQKRGLRIVEYGGTFISNQPPECMSELKVETPKTDSCWLRAPDQNLPTASLLSLTPHFSGVQIRGRVMGNRFN